MSRPVWISYQGQRIALRWIALRLSQQQREAAERRKRRKACLHQQRMQADTLYLAGWVLLVTTLPGEQWTDQQVLCLYQARWHIELVFKRIKQLLQQHRLRCTTAATAQPTLTALLLGWALLEEESTAVRLAMRDAMHSTQQAEEASQVQPEATHVSWWQDGCTGPLSEWLLAEGSRDLFCQQIRGSYTAARYRACLPRLQRFLGMGHRKRPHLYSQVCCWLGMPTTDLGKRGGCHDQEPFWGEYSLKFALMGRSPLPEREVSSLPSLVPRLPPQAAQERYLKSYRSTENQNIMKK